jgi:SNF2 family DNA or RNA helicase
MPFVAKELVQRGWLVQADGLPIQPVREFNLAVTSGIDWFELGGSIRFGDQSVELPKLLEAARRGESLVTLGDGSMGVLPEEWLHQYGMLADLSNVTPSQTGAIRVGKAQVGLLDALITAQPEIRFDAGFEQARQNLAQFQGVKEIATPTGFQGELRAYQRLGVGWLDYLTKFGFGGILADDMGLGKTIQVLAFLQHRKNTGASGKTPSLIVVPRSLVFNWLNEAERFTPGLKVLDYTGTHRHQLRSKFARHDLIVTTYGTMRSDIAELSAFEFDHLILDEAQAIKNADSLSARAARQLKGRHRLAITGTPIENHLGELWSIFEFLNPGMLGSATVFRRFAGPLTAPGRDKEKDKDGDPIGGDAPTRNASSNLADEGTRALLARSIRPFVLRRTKKQVVQDLPEKSELVLYCEMEPEQRKDYEELRTHYRRALLGKTKGGSHLEVLEALLRLRQASCHPGLIHPDRVDQPSAKLDVLLPHLAEVIEEGHKALIFSQFTRFLNIVKDRLDKEGIVYEYLDGKTHNRAERVERFQNDPNVPVFLISLKAGGLGLNLTAAEYVYLLDPWWNPAVEAQAIDRSHRIGQTSHVFAYRLICRDTVEQKIIELQKTKRALADAILGGEGEGMSALTRDDLEFLLS